MTAASRPLGLTQGQFQSQSGAQQDVPAGDAVAAEDLVAVGFADVCRFDPV